MRDHLKKEFLMGKVNFDLKNVNILIKVNFKMVFAMIEKVFLSRNFIFTKEDFKTEENKDGDV